MKSKIYHPSRPHPPPPTPNLQSIILLVFPIACLILFICLFANQGPSRGGGTCALKQ